MGILSFDEKALSIGLDQIPPPLRAIFAATIAERLFPAYANFSRKTGRGHPAKLADILERLWQDLKGTPMDAQELQESINLLMNLIPKEDDIPWIPEQAWAEDAAAATAYALRCRQTGDSREAAWAARRAYEALDHFVLTPIKIDTNVMGVEERALSSPLIQAELIRQLRDLRELKAESERGVAALAQQMRERAKSEAATVFSGN
jgi:uncharacterized protein YjaG (DUF416 family)